MDERRNRCALHHPDDEKKEAEDATKENEDLFNAMKEALGDKVEKVMHRRPGAGRVEIGIAFGSAGDGHELAADRVLAQWHIQKYP